jgi:hypothetical protein
MVVGRRIPAGRVSQNDHLYLRFGRQTALDRIIVAGDAGPAQIKINWSPIGFISIAWPGDTTRSDRSAVTSRFTVAKPTLSGFPSCKYDCPPLWASVTGRRPAHPKASIGLRTAPQPAPLPPSGRREAGIASRWRRHASLIEPSPKRHARRLACPRNRQ